jgi:hypothetical protein
MDKSPHKSDFVHVNGINLHNLDWGGNGDVLLFLDAAYDRSSASYEDLVENSPWKRMQPPGLDVDYFSPDEYFAAMKRAYPSFKLIWTEAMQQQSLHEITQAPDGKIMDRMSETISQALTNMMTGYVLEDAKIKAPALAFLPFPKVSTRFPMNG